MDNIKLFIILDYLLFLPFICFIYSFIFIFKGQNEVKNNGTTYNIFFPSFLLSHYAFIALGYRQEIITTILANSNQCKEQNQRVLSCLDYISMYRVHSFMLHLILQFSSLNVKIVHKIWKAVKSQNNYLKISFKRQELEKKVSTNQSIYLLRLKSNYQ